MRSKSLKIAVGVIAIIALVFMFIINPLLQSSNNKPKPGKVTKHLTEIPFTHEGTLWFMNGSDTIHTIDIEIADNNFERQRGLMHRKSMSDDQGMLFIFDQQRPQSFWMKNTHISLDIIYVQTNGQVVSIARNATPFSEQSLPSEGPAQYVVEINGGLSSKLKIDKGTTVVFERN